jgi:tetratricopeptide (TPR) repeat protein
LPSRQLASLYAEQDRVDEAVEMFQAAISRDPENFVTINNFANFLVDQPNRHEEALEMARKAFKLAPKNPLVADTLGWAMHRTGSSKEAVPLLDFAAARLPDNPLVQYHRGVLQYAEGSLEAARTSLQKALDTGETFPGMDEARELLAKIEETLPEDQPPEP